MRPTSLVLLLFSALVVTTCGGPQRPTVPTAAPAAPAVPTAASGRHWLDLDKDGVHDPTGPGLKLLQNPTEALSQLPAAIDGNQVDWMTALESKAIDPRSKISPDFEVNALDLDVYMPHTGSMPVVKFPHRQHTEWLDCTNCHNRIFKPQAGANSITMLAILQGEYCGQCHGAVSFPLTQCGRCHNVAPEDYAKMRRK